MKKLLIKKVKQTDDELDVLLQAVVSVYLYMAKTARLSGSEINVIDRILQSMFGNEIPLYKIEQSRHNVLSIRDAANQLNTHISPADKIKLILNLISLAYHDRAKIHVLGNVEIVELVDLLRIDVNILDKVYDVYESQAESLELDYDALASQIKHYILNSMVWGRTDSNFALKHTRDSYTFIMIENLVLVARNSSSDNDKAFLTDHDSGQQIHLQSQLFYRVTENATLTICSQDTEMNFELDDLWKIYSILFTSELLSQSASSQSSSKICFKDKKLLLISGKNRYGFKPYELALDEIVPELDPQRPVATLLTLKSEVQGQGESISERFLEYQEKKPRITTNRDSNTLARFYTEGESWNIEQIGDADLFLNRLPLSGTTAFNLNQDILSFENSSFIINRNWELFEIPLQIDELKVEDIYHRFKQEGNVAIDGVSFCLQQGSMMAIMGPSGSGKTTLLKILLGEIIPERARIKIDGIDFLSNYAFFQKHIGYVPQDDLLFANLTVYENLYYNLRLRLPRIKDKEEIRSRIFNLLKNVGLFDQRFMIVGDVMHKKLSGGQRRRLNIALELISNPMIIILDEPTSGLSSKDSENIAQFLNELKEQGKIIICTIHQPNATIFKQFDKIMLMDKGGCEVYFGSTQDVFNYFDTELAVVLETSTALATKKKLSMPEYLFDIIELSDHYQQRLFPPAYWKQKYRDYRFRMALDIENQHQDSRQDVSDQKSASESGLKLFSSLFLLVHRTFVNKLRSKVNLFMTLAVSPILAFFTAIILRSAPESETYSFYDNANFLLFSFISIIIFIFIGLANSVDDILSEKRIIQREKKMNISTGAMLNSKYIVLFFMTLLQCTLYYIVSASILGIKGSALPLMTGLILSGVIGYKIGLLSSSVIHDRSAVINILPLIIIPQIMFSGAVIRFSDMNPAIRIGKSHEIPEFCQLIPSRWLYEGMVLAQYHYNRHTLTLTKYTSLFKDKDIDGALRRERIKTYAALLEQYDETDHTNSMAFNMVRINHGKYLNENRNIFLSHTMKIGSREFKTVYLDLVVCLLIAGTCSLATWIKLKYYYD